MLKINHLAHYFTFQILLIVIMMVSATVVLFEAKRSHRRLYSIKDKREFMQAIDTLVSTSASHCDAYSHVVHYMFERLVTMKR